MEFGARLAVPGDTENLSQTTSKVFSGEDPTEDPIPFELTPEGEQVLEAARKLRSTLVRYAEAEQEGVIPINAFQPGVGEMVSVMRKTGVDMLHVDDVLDELQDISERGCTAFQLHFFAGLKPDRIATLMQIPERLAGRDVAIARVWFFERLKQITDKPA